MLLLLFPAAALLYLHWTGRTYADRPGAYRRKPSSADWDWLFGEGH